eukprot:PhM_4_TR10277/c0_g2_i1/m.97194/K02431/fucU, FUOM; L-fucose mutarotase
MPCQLFGVPALISPELISVLAQMGHGDEIVFADANFPSHSTAKKGRGELVSADAVTSMVGLLEAVGTVFPLDTFVQRPIAMMQPVPGDDTDVTEIVEEYTKALEAGAAKAKAAAELIGQQRIVGSSAKIDVEMVERFAFYERAQKAFAIVKTGECRKYANVILKKGIVL